MPINSFENYPMSWKPAIDKTEKPIYKAIAEKLEQDILQEVLLPEPNCLLRENWLIFWI